MALTQFARGPEKTDRSPKTDRSSFGTYLLGLMLLTLPIVFGLTCVVTTNHIAIFITTSFSYQPASFRALFLHDNAPWLVVESREYHIFHPICFRFCHDYLN